MSKKIKLVISSVIRTDYRSSCKDIMDKIFAVNLDDIKTEVSLIIEEFLVNYFINFEKCSSSTKSNTAWRIGRDLVNGEKLRFRSLSFENSRIFRSVLYTDKSNDNRFFLSFTMILPYAIVSEEEFLADFSN